MKDAREFLGNAMDLVMTKQVTKYNFWVLNAPNIAFRACQSLLEQKYRFLELKLANPEA